MEISFHGRLHNRSASPLVSCIGLVHYCDDNNDNNKDICNAPNSPKPQMRDDDDDDDSDEYGDELHLLDDSVAFMYQKQANYQILSLFSFSL